MKRASKAKKSLARRPAHKAAPRRPASKPKRAAPKPVAKSSARPTPKGSKGASSKAATPKTPPAAPVPPAAPRPGDGRRHLLSLSFLRDGDEFLARLETDGGQITELKNRALDQLLTLVAGELEDLLE